MSAVKMPASIVLAIARWLGWADICLALCAFGVSSSLLLQSKEPGADSLVFLQAGVLLYMGCAFSFSMAYVAISRKWRFWWLLQMIGPALIYLTIYGPW
ncbi:MAG: hypothetical protein ACJAYC_000826 [Halieaceae bacterium]|jgi:hypothetical protein